MIYVVTMYRWGSRGNHSYVLGGYKSKRDACKAGEKEAYERGGKYEYETVGINDDGEIFERYSEVDVTKANLDDWCARRKIEKLIEWLDHFEYENDIITVANVRKRLT